MNILNGTYQQGDGESTPVSLANSQNSGNYDQAQPGVGPNDPHGTSGPDYVNQDGPPDNFRGHWRLQIGADNDTNNQHEFSLINATANGLNLHTQAEVWLGDSLSDFAGEIDDGVNIYINKTTGGITVPWDSNAVQLESDGTTVYTIGTGSSTLTNDIAAAATTINVADLTGFSSLGGTAVIDGDVFTYTGTASTTTYADDGTYVLRSLGDSEGMTTFGLHDSYMTPTLSKQVLLGLRQLYFPLAAGVFLVSI